MLGRFGFKANKNTSQEVPQQQQRSISRSTYPGQRAANLSSAPTPPTPPPSSMPPQSTTSLLPTSTPRTAGGVSSSSFTTSPYMSSVSTSAGSAASTNTAGSSSSTVVRGSNVAPGTSFVPPPAKPTDDPTRPGAYQVTRSTYGPSQVYRVTVPQGVRPGTEFTVHAGPRRVRVRCPTTSRAGQSLQITLPPEPETHHLRLRMAPLTATGAVGGGTVEMTEEVRSVNEQAQASGGTAQSYLVTIPPNVYPGQQFTVNVSGQRFMVTCPSTAGPNMKVRIVPPTLPETSTAVPKTQVFEVAVPPGVVPGQPFALVANGQRVLVTCPPNVVAGQKIRFQLPVSQVVSNIQLSYESEKGGWVRTVRASDLKFQWVRMDNDDGVDTVSGFDFKKTAYVRKINFLEGNDARMRTGTVELVPASEATVDSRLVVHGRTLLSYSDISSIQGKTLDEKTEWFHRICDQLTVPFEDGHIKFMLRRKFLLTDSLDAVMSLGRDDLRKRWRIEFLGEPAIDAGGVTREWFELITEQVFEPASGLFVVSTNNQACVNINPASGISCPDDHLIYFRFLGRILGRALFDKQIVKGHFVQTIYKHLLGWPVTVEDIQSQDEDYYKALRKLTELSPDDIPNMCLDFTVTEESLGFRNDVELVEGGSQMEVTAENLPQYLEANMKYRLMDRIKPQLTELLLGFYDIAPEPALTVFDANEIELILCGMPNIDMDDWMANTNYSGLFSSKGRSSEVVRWFWEVVSEDFDVEMKARLLQFVTGTSGVPSRGFSVLQGNDGNIKKFTIHGIDTEMSSFPRAHTCFNRIDLPTYDSKEELHEKLKIAVTMSGVGFGIE